MDTTRPSRRRSSTHPHLHPHSPESPSHPNMTLPRRRTTSSSAISPETTFRRRSSILSNSGSKSHRESFSTSTGQTHSEFGDINMTPSSSRSASISEWEDGYQVRAETNRQKKRKKDEPMRPVTVVLYVICFYLIWQILTRSDESEILSHLPLSSPLHSMSSSIQDIRHYQPQYQFPHIPSPISSLGSSNSDNASSGSGSGGSSTFKVVLGVIVYPIYLIITLLATPLPLLQTALRLILSVLGTVLYPITSTFKVLSKTFLLTPFNLIRSVLAVFYPLYVFVAGVTGVGCVMGVGAGWLGKISLDWIFSRTAKKTNSNISKQRRSEKHISSDSKSNSRSKSSSKYASKPTHEHLEHNFDRQSRTERPHRVVNPAKSNDNNRFKRDKRSPSTAEEYEDLRTPKADARQVFPPNEGDFSEDDIDERQFQDEYAGRKGRRRSSVTASGREGHVVGIRKRGVRDNWAER